MAPCSEVSDIIASKQMKATTLVILAAGMGSRFGGAKQIEPVTPEGETILDFSLYDAVNTGFRKIVFVVRREILGEFRQIFDRKLEGKLDLSYVCQDDFESSDLDGTLLGTGHAVLAARDSVDENFCVINADDFYGRSAFELIADWDVSPTSTEFAMIGFKLNDTLSEFGGVSRGQCSISGKGYLTSIIERTGILSENGIISCDEQGTGYELKTDTVVSMNFWGFTPAIFEPLERGLREFLGSAGRENTEYYINDFINAAVSGEQASVRVVGSGGSWMGITYREDKAAVAVKLAELRKDGIYPSRLW